MDGRPSVVPKAWQGFVAGWLQNGLFPVIGKLRYRVRYEQIAKGHGNIVQHPADPTVSRPDSSKPDPRVLRFRPRGSLLVRPTARPPVVPDLDKYERSSEDPAEYRHRMMMNLIGLAFAVGLIGAGLWIAEVMANLRKNQDCAFSGRRNCTEIQTPLDAR